MDAFIKLLLWLFEIRMWYGASHGTAGKISTQEFLHVYTYFVCFYFGAVSQVLCDQKEKKSLSGILRESSFGDTKGI